MHIADGWGDLVDSVPFIYQEIGGQQVQVAGRFVLWDDRTYAFEITGAYDRARPLVIDPDVTWATYLGGSGPDGASGISVDSAGNAFVTGSTYSTDFSGVSNALHGRYEAFVAKVSPSGLLLWATYVGGSGDDFGFGISVDSAGNAFMTGTTKLTIDEPPTIYVDAFVAKISSLGFLEWATLLGGSSDDEGIGVSVDAAGNAFVTGWTYSTDFLGANNEFHGHDYGDGTVADCDAFVAKVLPSGLLAWATYLGGSRTSREGDGADDFGYGISVDAAGNAFVMGKTYSSDFWGANNAFNGGCICICGT